MGRFAEVLFPLNPFPSGVELHTGRDKWSWFIGKPPKPEVFQEVCDKFELEKLHGLGVIT